MGFLEIVKNVVDDADIVIEVIDARFPEKSRNAELERMVKNKKKKLILLLNKTDLIGKEAAAGHRRQMGQNCVFVSATNREGTSSLRRKIGELANGRTVKVAIVGYPNVGKSSIINVLSRKRAARTSPRAGFTRGRQFVRVSRNIMLIDTPGVIQVDDKDETLMVMLGSKNLEQVKDLESTGVEIADILLKSNPEELGAFYGVGNAADGEEFLEKLALCRNKLLRGARPDLNAAARLLINDMQKGNLRLRNKFSTWEKQE